MIQTPSANSMNEGTVAFTFNKNNIWKIGTLTVSPFEWLEASYFYHRPKDLEWLGNDPGLYLDKGFNIKFIYKPQNKNLPNIAIGLDDFAGTGLFSREYIVSTLNYRNLNISLGMGWGKYNGENSFENPLGSIKEAFKFRPQVSDNFNFAGSLAYDQWLRGDVGIFGGIEYYFSSLNGLGLKLEYDPFNYMDFSANYRDDANFELRKKDSPINVGFVYPYNKYINMNVSFIKGNTFNFAINAAITFNNERIKKPEFNPKTTLADPDKNTFYEDLLFNLNNNQLLLQTANLENNNKLEISISTSEHRNALRSSSRAATISRNVAQIHSIKLSSINVSHINAGVELNNITYISNHLDKASRAPIEVKKRYTTFDSGNPDGYKKHSFKPRVDFPVIFSSTAPALVNHIGNPGKFYFGGVNIQNISEIQFSRNLLLSSQINYLVYSNFKNLNSNPDSVMEHVRTDLVDYLKEDDPYISRLQLDYIWSPKKDIYTKVSGGIFENMFGGIGGELLFKPFAKNYYIGAELFYVKQREFDQRFKFQNYDTVTGHINIGYKFAAGVESNLSYGRYLAKDDGFTFDLSRTTKSGFKAGIYFTRTDVSAEVFGEGSFDKGFYFQIPLDLLSRGYTGSYSTFKISPLTRDGGAKLIHAKDLKGLISNATLYDLNRQWDGFLN